VEGVNEGLQSTSYDVWYRAVRPRLLTAIVALRVPLDDADEIVDEALELAWLKWPEVSQMDAPQGWVFKTATNLWRNRRRHQAVQRRFARTGQDGVDRELPYRDESLLEFRSLIEELPRRYQRILVWLYAFEWGRRVLMRGGGGRVEGQLMPPAWSSTRSR
jgi:DNA-directed RNA polymerase specialized sigma24 family protein